jgi:hypothetical protein
VSAKLLTSEPNGRFRQKENDHDPVFSVRPALRRLLRRCPELRRNRRQRRRSHRSDRLNDPPGATDMKQSILIGLIGFASTVMLMMGSAHATLI